MSVDYSACTKCLDERPHPWHDDGSRNHDDRFTADGPNAAPKHLEEE